MTLPNHPQLDHHGSLTVWKMVGTKKLADDARRVIEDAVGESHVDLFWEEEGEEQKAIRVQRQKG